MGDCFGSEEAEAAATRHRASRRKVELVHEQHHQVAAVAATICPWEQPAVQSSASPGRSTRSRRGGSWRSPTSESSRSRSSGRRRGTSSRTAYSARVGLGERWSCFSSSRAESKATARPSPVAPPPHPSPPPLLSPPVVSRAPQSSRTAGCQEESEEESAGQLSLYGRIVAPLDTDENRAGPPSKYACQLPLWAYGR
uniref:Uncharacterized protein n=1 Tax=Oryza sativa subsp. japonica TaxID=39947 RepID=Q6H6S8_ORYSJ|nr:hypothetical protein [Oryza sativa Japonica Group]BAD25571.1 hypothetical protein [Oryza sativa Japonica Group]